MHFEVSMKKIGMQLNVEVAYGYTCTENRKQDDQLIHLLMKKLNMFLAVYFVPDNTDLHIEFTYN